MLRTILLTGANTGIGRATAMALARAGASLYLAGRSEERHRDVLAAIRSGGGRASFLPLDLGSLSSVRELAARFTALGEPLHVLVNNAGIAGAHGLTTDGFELAFGVNHLGHFLLTELLLEVLQRSAPSRIVNVASVAHEDVQRLEWDTLRRPTRTLTGLQEYAVSKLCNVLHARELSRRLEGTGVTTYSLHPGVVASDIWRRVPWGVRHVMTRFMDSTEAGAATPVHCATSDEVARQSGLYYVKCRPRPASALGSDAALARELYERSLVWAGVRGARSGYGSAGGSAEPREGRG